ncbi:uncharacterized protein N7503_001362 [Penicillium pulvis]|uniref:uncharacterized protein n=1 Tax=Penicillium pulvis TaxID=1562058 RepID=UPI00254887FE|nr:uncharacterized protein N7503_001362 [Penicillium pulvis]KAJ5563873.1 hypothetical protein N7513_000115 [Penicillium glabrum]KAJ5809144.1 hypothetical protein N7503_001362 [Penicillium pulvis]
MSVPLTKVDSAIAGLSIQDEKPLAPTETEVKKEKKSRRLSSQAEDVWNIKDLEEQKIEITLPIETQKTGWRLNTSPNTVEDKDILKLKLTNPPVKKIDLHFPLGLEVTARNLKGVTIKDALEAIHKQFKKKADDELEKPYLAGFEWDKEECWTRFIVHQTDKNTAPHQNENSKKSKKKKKDEE